MTITVDSAAGGDCRVVRVAGEIDVQTGPEVGEAVTELVRQGAQHVVLDLGDVTFLDSSGVGAIIACAKALAPHGKLVLARPQTRVAKVLDLTGLGQHIEIYDSVELAQQG